MASLPTGCNKVLELQTNELRLVIKSAAPLPEISAKQNSELQIIGEGITGIGLWGNEVLHNAELSQGRYLLPCCPLFFEEQSYEFIVKSTDGKPLSLWHSNPELRQSISAITEEGDLLSGVISFENQAGFSDFAFYHGNKKCLVLRIEVFPLLLSYKEDYHAMLQDISQELHEAVLDFMGKTYREFSQSTTQSDSPAVFFEILRVVYHKFYQAAKTILSLPHHKLTIERRIVPAHKGRKTDSHSLRWLEKHPKHLVSSSSGLGASKALVTEKQVTFNTAENRFAKFMLLSVVKRLQEFRNRYLRCTPAPEQQIMEQIDSMLHSLQKLVSSSFLSQIGNVHPLHSMSLVFEMAPGYRELYKYYLMLSRSLTVHADVFRMSLKDTAVLYEYWCFLKLVKILKQKCKLVSSDVIKIDHSGITLSLLKGKESEVRFVNPRTGERICLTYHPGAQHSATVAQKPGNILSLEKKGSSVPYQYIFDARYAMDSGFPDSADPCSKPGPRAEDLHAMHSYRDAIVYENPLSARYLYEKTMFGAYILFPYADPQGSYHEHPFYKSIAKVNIGGLPFLPGATKLVEEFLSQLLADTSEDAFARSSLPRGIEERLSEIDWSTKDVMVGTVRSREQLEFNLSHRGYYVPEKHLSEEQLPIGYIALHEEHLGQEAGIRRVGQVLTVQKIKRGRIPVSMRPGADPNEIYYYFTVRSWELLPHTIAIADSFRGKPQFTNHFLLEHCTKSYQLFSVSSQEEYRLLMELSKLADKPESLHYAQEPKVLPVNRQCSVIAVETSFTIANRKGEIVDQIPISSFIHSPRAAFARIKKNISHL